MKAGDIVTSCSVIWAIFGQNMRWCG